MFNILVEFFFDNIGSEFYVLKKSSDFNQISTGSRSYYDPDPLKSAGSESKRINLIRISFHFIIVVAGAYRRGIPLSTKEGNTYP